MEKTIVIDGKNVVFKSTGATPLRYKQQFGKDFFAELAKMEKAFNTKEDSYESLDFEAFYNIAWTLAKTADKEIASPLEWLDTFDEFPIVDIIPELQDILARMLNSKKK